MATNLFLNLKDKIPKSSHVYMKNRLDNLDDNVAGNISMLNLKDPIIGLVLGLFLGALGVDRFYKGNILLGVLKLFTLGGFGIWTIIDWFVVFGGIKKDNLEKINLAL